MQRPKNSSLFHMWLMIWILIVLTIHPFQVFPQNNLADSIHKIFPEVKSEHDFNRARIILSNCISIGGYSIQLGYTEQKRLTNLADEWAKANGNESQKWAMDVYQLFSDTTQKNIIGYIEKLNKLIKYPYAQDNPESHAVYLEISRKYEALAHYREVLELIPTIYRLNQKFHPGLQIEPYKYREIATILFRMKSYPKAIENFRIFDKSLEAIPQNFHHRGSLNNDIGLCFKNIGQRDSAVKYFNISQQLMQAHINQGFSNPHPVYIQYFIDVVAANKVDLAVESGNYVNADKAYLRQLTGAKIFSEFHIITSSFYSLANLYFLQEKPNQALQYVDSVFQTIAIQPHNDYFQKTLNLKGKCLLLLGKANEAEIVFAIQNRFNDSLEQIQTSQNYAVASSKFETELKENEILKFKQEVNLRKARENTMSIGLKLGAIIIGLVLLYSFNQIKNKRKFARKNQDLAKSLSEKEILLKEVHHRVKNNLHIVSGLLQLQSTKLNSPEASILFKESQQYILSMSTVHQMLYQENDLRRINMKKYFHRFFASLLDHYSDKEVNLIAESENVELSLDQALIIGVLCSELITNSMKYAFETDKGDISVSLEKLEFDCFKFSYTDSGTGFKKSEALPLHKKTLGMKLIGMMAEQLDGELKIITENKFKLELSFKTEIV